MTYFEHIESLWLNLERILSTLMPNHECTYQIPVLPPPVELETLEILKALTVATDIWQSLRAWPRLSQTRRF